MKRMSAIFVALFFLLSEKLAAQNADLLLHSAFGQYRAMAGAGSALASDHAALAMNPAGLAHARGASFALAANASSYSFSLLRRNSNGTAFDLNWSEPSTAVDYASIHLATGKRWGFAAGYLRKLDPFVDNNRRAITGSVLFHQSTSGGVYALAFAAGYKLNARFSLGAALHHNNGTITSKIDGDNHGRDADKHAQLESTLAGFSMQTALMFAAQKFRAAVRMATPTNLEVKTRSEITADNSYVIYLPSYAQIDFELPLVLGLGAAYIVSDRLTLALDFETQRFRSSPLQFNLYEFGGKPNWRDANLLRVGFEVLPFKTANVPVRFGYARLPQLYASNNSRGEQNSILSYSDTEQNVQHLFAAGTTLRLQRFALSLGLEYGYLKWHRDLQTTTTVRDDYREIKLALISEVVWHWQ